MLLCATLPVCVPLAALHQWSAINDVHYTRHTGMRPHHH